MKPEPDRGLDADEQLQQLFDSTAQVPSSDQVERLLDHARRMGAPAARPGAPSWLRRWWPALAPGLAAALAIGVWAGVRVSPQVPQRPSAEGSVVPSADSATAREPVGAAGAAPSVGDNPEVNEASGDPEAWADPWVDDGWDGTDDLELLHPPESGQAGREWVALVEEDLAGGR